MHGQDIIRGTCVRYSQKSGTQEEGRQQDDWRWCSPFISESHQWLAAYGETCIEEDGRFRDQDDRYSETRVVASDEQTSLRNQACTADAQRRSDCSALATQITKPTGTVLMRAALVITIIGAAFLVGAA
jgi:hypothetical protein